MTRQTDKMMINRKENKLLNIRTQLIGLSIDRVK